MRRKATRVIRTYGAVGRCTCSECNWRIDPYDNFCRRCGSELVKTEYREVGKDGRDGGEVQA